MTRFTDDYLLYLLAQASGRASAEFHAQLVAQGVPVSTWRIIASLFPDAPASIGELARSCLAKQPTMTRQVARLEAQGLVARSMSAGDRRRVIVRLTATGRALAKRLTAQAKAHEARILADRGQQEITALKAMLRGLPPVAGKDAE